MKTLHFAKPNNLSRLHDELLVAIPALQPIRNASGEMAAAMQVEGTDTDVWLTVPDVADETAIATVVQTHDPAAVPPPPPPSLRRQRVDELLAIPRSDWTVAQMRELLQIVAQATVPSPASGEG